MDDLIQRLRDADAKIERLKSELLHRDMTVLPAKDAELESLQARNRTLTEALKAERDLRILGQRDDVHWESLRDLRRQVYGATDAALGQE